MALLQFPLSHLFSRFNDLNLQSQLQLHVQGWTWQVQDCFDLGGIHLAVSGIDHEPWNDTEDVKLTFLLLDKPLENAPHVLHMLLLGP